MHCDPPLPLLHYSKAAAKVTSGAGLEQGKSKEEMPPSHLSPLAGKCLVPHSLGSQPWLHIGTTWGRPGLTLDQLDKMGGESCHRGGRVGTLLPYFVENPSRILEPCQEWAAPVPEGHLGEGRLGTQARAAQAAGTGCGQQRASYTSGQSQAPGGAINRPDLPGD